MNMGLHYTIKIILCPVLNKLKSIWKKVREERSRHGEKQKDLTNSEDH